jgi:hypothetical protein
MPNVTEAEILSKLVESFRLAADYAEALAILPARGPTYTKLREELKLAEGCCRQVAYYREDSRWFQVGLLMEQAHKRAGTWLRVHPRTENSNLAHPLFLKLAENLRAAQKRAHELQTRATGRVGMILPDALPGATRTEGRMVQVKSGLIVPESYAA